MKLKIGFAHLKSCANSYRIQFQTIFICFKRLGKLPLFKQLEASLIFFYVVISRQLIDLSSVSELTCVDCELKWTFKIVSLGFFLF